MASITNAFDLLKGAESKLQSKKNKKKAGKDAAQASEPSTSAAIESLPRAQGGVVDVFEAVAVLERAAREARSVSDKCKVWKEWIRQAGERAGKGVKYKEVDGTFLDFRQVLLRSRGLEISLEGAMGSGLTVDHEDVLTQLLLSFSGRLDARSAASLASALVRLSILTEDEPLDVKGAAQRAAHAVAAAVKANTDAGATAETAAIDAWVAKVSSLGQTIAKEQGLLQKLAAAGRGGATKEHAEIARKIFSLTGQQFDLLQSDSVPTAGAGTTQSYAPALSALHAAVSSKIRVAGDDKPKGGKGGDAASKQAALASLRKEEALVSQQCDSVSAQIRTLEAQLRSLRAQQQELDDRRTQLQQRMRVANDPSAQGKKGALGVAHHQEELAVVNSISDILSSTGVHGSESEQIANVQAASQSVSGDFVLAGRQYLEIAKAAIAEVPGKLAFCKQRQTQAQGLLKLGSKEGQRIQSEADKLYSETVKSADDILKTSVEVVDSLRTRSDAVLRSLADADTGVTDALRVADQLLADIQAQYDAVQALIRPPAPAAPATRAAAPAAAPLANGKHHPVPAANAPRSAAPVAVAPAAQRPASAAPTVQRPASATPVVQAATPPAPAAAPVVPAPVAAQAAAPKSAFDAAAAYLANAKQIAPAVRSESPVAAAARKPASAPPSRPVAAPVASTSAPRQWGKPAAGAGTSAPAADSGSALPTPAEAMAAARVASPAAAPGPSSNQSEEVQAKKKKTKPRA